MNLTESNLITLNTELKAGQRCIRIGNSIIPVGVGGISAPGSNSSTPSGGSMDFYKCSYVNSDSWGGYKALFNGQYYEFQSNSTVGLIYTEQIPVIGQTYSSNALIRAILYQGLNRGLVFYATLSDSSTVAKTGQTLVQSNVTFSAVDGIPCAVFEGQNWSYIYTSNGTDFPVANQTSTLSCWVRFNQLGSWNSWFMAYGSGYYDMLRGMFAEHDTANAATGTWGESGDNVSDVSLSVDTWYHFAAIFTSSGQALYLNGQNITNHSYDGMNTTFQKLSIGGYFGSGDSTLMQYANCCVAAVRVYNRTLNPTQIATLAAEFTPTVS